MITSSVPFRRVQFPCGEPHFILDVQLEEGAYLSGGNVNIEWEFQSAAELVDLLLIADAAKRADFKLQRLSIPYVPFGRQDRLNQRGEPLSIKVFADLVNDLGAREVLIVDPHSDVTAALIDRCTVIPQWEVFLPRLEERKDYWLVSPDAGALKKIHKLAPMVDCLGVIECSKKRDSLGQIVGTKVNWDYRSAADAEDFIIVDDICDGGATFTAIAKILKDGGARKVSLMVTHGFFTKGIEALDNIDEVYTRKGKIK